MYRNSTEPCHTHTSKYKEDSVSFETPMLLPENCTQCVSPLAEFIMYVLARR